ncbi:GNAT family N-acetyltransferase [Roseobacter sp. HKCCA0434]|uniref:GNAT family N-acetyltransferase n=1 Tax=Roseobacter sp. HKCCA0434 TaxID=3079297 RepID=UPI002905EEF0|nr:GNAT family N-acetyltransferase [Roseobacter sp. HKCCA0434]
MRVRTAISDDIPGIDALLARSYPRLLAADYPPSVLFTALPLISRAQPALVTTAAVGHVRHVASDPERLRRGIARRLLEHVIAKARAAGLTRLDCLSTRTAVPFYEAMGFGVVAPRDIPLAPAITFPAIETTRSLA